VTVSASVQQTRGEQRLHHHRDTARAVDVGHDVAAERLDVGEVRNLVADAVEVVEAQLDLRLDRDSQQVQHGIGRTPQRHDHGDGVLEGRLGQDRARRDTAVDEVYDRLAGALGVVVATCVRCRRRRRAR